MIQHKKAAQIRDEATTALLNQMHSLDVSAITTSAMSRHKGNGEFHGELDTLLRLAVTRFDARRLIAEAEQDMG